MYRPGQLPGRSSIISGELQAGGNSICLCLTGVFLLPPRRPPWTACIHNVIRILSTSRTSHLKNFNILCLLFSRYLSRWSRSRTTSHHLSPEFDSLFFTFPWITFRSWCTQWMRRASCTSDTSCAVIPAGSRGSTLEVKAYFGALHSLASASRPIPTASTFVQ
jgi:hypothetical protein